MKKLVNSNEMKVNIVNTSDNALPKYQTISSAGMDLRANLDNPVELGPLQRSLIPTGLFVSLPDGCEAQIRPRSGLAYKQGITVLNTPGTIDADYRGEIKVLLVNLSDKTVSISHGERVAQMVVTKHEKVEWQVAESLDSSARERGGFGSTGTH